MSYEENEAMSVGVRPVPGAAAIPTEDTGLNTNPRRYEKDNGFVSARTTVADGPTAVAIWAVDVACVNNPSGVPADGRTSGHKTTVCSLEIENSTGGEVTAWLEDEDGNRISVDYHVANNDTVVLDFSAGKTYGDMDIYINASVAEVVGQISGTEA